MNDTVILHMIFEDGSKGVTQPIPRWLADAACADFANGEPWLNGKHVTWAKAETMNGVLN